MRAVKRLPVDPISAVHVTTPLADTHADTTNSHLRAGLAAETICDRTTATRVRVLARAINAAFPNAATTTVAPDPDNPHRPDDDRVKIGVTTPRYDANGVVATRVTHVATAQLAALVHPHAMIGRHPLGHAAHAIRLQPTPAPVCGGPAERRRLGAVASGAMKSRCWERARVDAQTFAIRA